MDLLKVKKELSIKGKNGIAFLLAGAVVWLLIMLIFLQPITIYQKNIFMLFSTGLVFPLAILASKLLNAEWKFEGNPLASLGVYLNVAQIIYFPLVLWAIVNSPNEAVYFFAVIVGAHFFPYGWFYNAKPYYIMAPFITVAFMVIGWGLQGERLWLIPMAMVLFLVILIGLLYVDYKKKALHPDFH
ncbi:DUF7010 family protein [Salsuginibacillus kocurii]|uniref:DUF7010 family protein n=1 Tax=Salsuginibacillus kocurii TaxID=427078 RepID=UPI0003AA072D|nr:hypothetical protein [Salsuginibacillus kocurii]